MEGSDSDKPSSLVRNAIKNYHKKFYITGRWIGWFVVISCSCYFYFFELLSSGKRRVVCPDFLGHKFGRR